MSSSSGGSGAEDDSGLLDDAACELAPEETCELGDCCEEDDGRLLDDSA